MSNQLIGWVGSVTDSCSETTKFPRLKLGVLMQIDMGTVRCIFIWINYLSIPLDIESREKVRKSIMPIQLQQASLGTLHHAVHDNARVDNCTIAAFVKCCQLVWCWVFDHEITSLQHWLTYTCYQLRHELNSYSAHWCISWSLVMRRHTSMTCCSQFLG